MATFILDTRNQVDDFVERALRARGHECVRLQLYFGDVAVKGREHNAIDLKSSSGGIPELMRNVCSKDHERLRREINKCQAYGGKLTFLVFEPSVKKMEDILKYKTPTFKSTAFRVYYTNRQTGQRANVVQIRQAYDRDLKAGKVILGSLDYEAGFANYKKTFYALNRELAHSKGEAITQVKPETLYKALKTMSEPNHYGEGSQINFEFTTKETCGEIIERLLLGDNNG